MATRIDQVRSTDGVRAEWLDGTAWRLEQGVDFNCRADTMQQKLRRAAKSRGLTLHTHTDVESVEVQAVRS